MMNTGDHIPVDLLIESTAGGSVRHVLDLYEALTKRGTDVRLIVSMLRADQMFIDRLGSIDPQRVLRIDMHRSPHPSDIAVAYRLRNLLKQSRHPRILHAHSTKAGMIAAMVRGHTAGTLFTPHAYRGMDPQLGGIRRALLGYAENIISRFHDCVIAVSPAELDYARSIGLDESRIVYIPNGIDLQELCRKAEAFRKPRASKAPVIGFVGRMTYQKNPMLFLKAFERILERYPEARALMLGDGPMLDEMRACVEASSLRGRVEMPGHANTLERILEMDIMLHTSLYESLPYSLLEGCAVGLPVVSVRNAGSVTVLGDSNSLASDLHDPAGLAERCLALLDSGENFAVARQKSQDAAQRFSIEAMTTSIQHQYTLLQENRLNARLSTPQAA